MADFYQDYVVPISRFPGNPAVVWCRRLLETGKFMLGFDLAAVAALGFLLRPRPWPSLAWASIAVASASFAVCAWFALHYPAPIAAVFVFIAVAGARSLVLALPRLRRRSLALGGALLAVHAALIAASGAPAATSSFATPLRHNSGPPISWRPIRAASLSLSVARCPTT